MQLQITWRNIAVTVALAVIIGVVISTVRDNPPGSQTEMLNGAAGELSTPAVIGAAQRDGRPASDALLMIQGLKSRRLVIWPLSGNTTPIEIDAQIASLELRPDPTGTRVLYSTDRAAMVLDVEQRRATIAGELPEGARLTAAQWSPDGSALAYVVLNDTRLTAYYTRADSLQEAEVMFETHYGLGLDVGWLRDGRPVVIYLGLGPVGGFETQLELFDPATSERLPLPPDTEIVQPWSPWRSPDGKQQIYGLSAWEDMRYKGKCRTGPLVLIGQDWLPVAVQSGGQEYKVAFELEGLFMDWPTWLADGRVVFRGIADPVCTPLDSGLYVGEIGHVPRKLVAAEPSYFSDESEKQMWSVVYALSPDQTGIAWTDNDVEAQRSTIYLKSLDGGSTETLFQTPPVTDPTPFAYRDQVMILHFIWLP